ncbi:MAG: hypothetical protein KC900_06650 [Candidatus Omnitrophica bacterium]|nr:hypothetical protein [Candidatus Omnitrophota bacterium]
MVNSPQSTGRLAVYIARRDDCWKAINFSKSIRDRGRRRSYLLEKAQGFLSADEYDHAALLAWHILYQVDARSLQAHQILNLAYHRIFSRPPRP